jgi:glycosyltransferase involved in cell wall biosynthesis
MDEAQPRRLLFIVNVGWFFLSHRLPLALAARRAGFDVHVAADVDDESEVQAIRAHGLHFHRIRLRRSATQLGSEWRTLRDIYALVRRLRPDICHHVTIKPVIYGSMVARLLRVPAMVNALPGLGFIFTARGTWARLRRELTALAYRLLLSRRNSLVIVQNQDDLRELCAQRVLNPRQTRLIRGSGVDLRRLAPVAPPAGTPLVILPARMLWDKGIREFCEAAAQLRRAGVAARFALVGSLDPDNPAGATLEQLDELTAQHSVEWWGFRADMAEVLAQCHVVCLPSYREGLPKALIEAAAAGRPVVTCDVPGCREVVRPGVSGYLVPARDPVALAQALGDLLQDSARRAAFGREARRMAEAEFSIDSVVVKTLAIYSELRTDRVAGPAFAARIAR